MPFDSVFIYILFALGFIFVVYLLMRRNNDESNDETYDTTYSRSNTRKNSVSPESKEKLDAYKSDLKYKEMKTWIEEYRNNVFDYYLYVYMHEKKVPKQEQEVILGGKELRTEKPMLNFEIETNKWLMTEIDSISKKVCEDLGMEVVDENLPLPRTSETCDNWAKRQAKEKIDAFPKSPEEKS